MHNSSQVSSIVIENRKKKGPQRDFKRMFGPLERERERERVSSSSRERERVRESDRKSGGCPA